MEKPITIIIQGYVDKEFAREIGTGDSGDSIHRMNGEGMLLMNRWVGRMLYSELDVHVTVTREV